MPPRLSHILHPIIPPAPLRMAASVLLLRQGIQGMEVLLTRRSQQAGFAGGMYVFPGGMVDEADYAAAAAVPQSDPANSPATDSITFHAWRLAAVREAFEEVGVLLAYHMHTGQDAQQADVDTLHARIGRRASAAQFYAALAELQLAPAADSLYLLGRWVAPLDVPRRFDTPFFVATMPAGQQPVPDSHEQTEVCWLRPAQALEQHRQGKLSAMFPTLRTLEKINGYDDVYDLIKSMENHTPWHYQPRGALQGGCEVRITPDEPAYGEIGLVAPGGQVVHVLDWQHTQPVPLLRHVQRLTAPNASMMTGPGTNSYIIGSPRSGYIVIDPGPAQSAHVQRLLHATGGAIRTIVCTHSHPDHSPGAALLQQICQQQYGHSPTIAGMASGAQARADSYFQPEQPLQHGDVLTLCEDALPTSISSAPAGHNVALHATPHPHPTLADAMLSDTAAPAITHSLLVLHTPGHASNHLCLLLREDGLLFSGDHVLGGSTTVIAPPDGDMGDYLAALNMLQTVCQQYGVSHILPAHGHVLEQPATVLARLTSHRLAREAKVRHAMQQHPHGSLDDWLVLAYDDTPQHLWPVARQSLLAHVLHIRQQHPLPDIC